MNPRQGSPLCLLWLTAVANRPKTGTHLRQDALSACLSPPRRAKCPFFAGFPQLDAKNPHKIRLPRFSTRRALLYHATIAVATLDSTIKEDLWQV
jgi:hypothetical protein